MYGRTAGRKEAECFRYTKLIRKNGLIRVESLSAKYTDRIPCLWSSKPFSKGPVQVSHKHIPLKRAYILFLLFLDYRLFLLLLPLSLVTIAIFTSISPGTSLQENFFGS